MQLTLVGHKIQTELHSYYTHFAIEHIFCGHNVVTYTTEVPSLRVMSKNIDDSSRTAHIFSQSDAL